MTSTDAIPGSPSGLRLASAPGRWVLLAAVLGSAVASIDATVVGIALPAIGRDFGVSLTALQWVVTAYTSPWLACCWWPDRLGLVAARVPGEDGTVSSPPTMAGWAF